MRSAPRRRSAGPSEPIAMPGLTCPACARGGHGRATTGMARATLIMIAAPLAQFVLGMAANLFVTIPAHHPGASPKNYLAGPATAQARPLPQACCPSPRT